MAISLACGGCRVISRSPAGLAEAQRPGVLRVDQKDDPPSADRVGLARVFAGDPIDDGPGPVAVDPFCDAAADHRRSDRLPWAVIEIATRGSRSIAGLFVKPAQWGTRS